MVVCVDVNDWWWVWMLIIGGVYGWWCVLMLMTYGVCLCVCVCADANTGVTEGSAAGHCCAHASTWQEQESR